MYNPGVGRFIQRDPIFNANSAIPGSAEEGQYSNIYLYAESQPILITDPSGLWSYKGMGTINASLEHHPTELGSSNFDARLYYDVKEFSSTPTSGKTCCTEVNWVQIHWFETDGKGAKMSGTKVQKTWHIDSDTLPYYPHATPVDPNRVNNVGMTDQPGLNVGAPTYLTQKFEACVVCTKGGDVGVVLGCMTWSHQIWYSANWWGTSANQKLWVINGKTKRAIYTGTWSEKLLSVKSEPVKAPSSDMITLILKPYFP